MKFIVSTLRLQVISVTPDKAHPVWCSSAPWVWSTCQQELFSIMVTHFWKRVWQHNRCYCSLVHINCVSLWRPNLIHMQSSTLQPEQVKQIKCLKYKTHQLNFSRLYWCFSQYHPPKTVRNHFFLQLSTSYLF